MTLSIARSGANPVESAEKWKAFSPCLETFEKSELSEKLFRDGLA